MCPARKRAPLPLPARKARQTLQGFICEHLKVIERAQSDGVPYESLVEAVHAAGFTKGTVRSLRVAVHEARKRALECAHVHTTQTPASVSTQPVKPVQQSSQPPPKDDRAAIARRLRELARPPRPGEKDPLN
jgi:hypothetical protein